LYSVPRARGGMDTIMAKLKAMRETRETKENSNCPVRRMMLIL
jgi:hypothetical protein